MLSAKSQGVFLPEQLVVRSCSYIMSAVTLAITWQQLKQNVMPLVTHVIFPVLCFESRDRTLWEEVSMLLTKPLYVLNLSIGGDRALWEEVSLLRPCYGLY